MTNAAETITTEFNTFRIRQAPGGNGIAMLVEWLGEEWEGERKWIGRWFSTPESARSYLAERVASDAGVDTAIS